MEKVKQERRIKIRIFLFTFSSRVKFAFLYWYEVAGAKQGVQEDEANFLME